MRKLFGAFISLVITVIISVAIGGLVFKGCALENEPESSLKYTRWLSAAVGLGIGAFFGLSVGT